MIQFDRYDQEISQLEITKTRKLYSDGEWIDTQTNILKATITAKKDVSSLYLKVKPDISIALENEVILYDPFLVALSKNQITYHFHLAKKNPLFNGEGYEKIEYQMKNDNNEYVSARSIDGDKLREQAMLNWHHKIGNLLGKTLTKGKIIYSFDQFMLPEGDTIPIITLAEVKKEISCPKHSILSEQKCLQINFRYSSNINEFTIEDQKFLVKVIKENPGRFQGKTYFLSFIFGLGERLVSINTAKIYYEKYNHRYVFPKQKVRQKKYTLVENGIYKIKDTYSPQ